MGALGNAGSARGIRTPAGIRTRADARVAAGHDENEGVTSDIDGRPVRLDYGLVGAALAHLIGAVSIDSEAQGSDHQPRWVELAL